jgi:hypothetical protein
LTFPASRDQKIFGIRPCPKIVQVSWLLTSPKAAHGAGSKDADNDIIYRWDGLPIKSRGFANPKAGSPSQLVYDANSFSGMKGTWFRMI